MTTRNSVRDILYRAGSEGAPLRAERAFSSPVQGVAVILRALDDTVLPRLVDLRFDNGACLSLELAERQVLAVVRLAPQRGRADTECGVAVGPLASDDAETFIAALTAFCRGAGSVRVCASADAGIATGMGGISVAALHRAAGVPQVGAVPDLGALEDRATWIDAMVDHDKVDMLSAVLIDVDEAHVVLGSKEEAESLADWAVEMLDVFLADGFPLAPELETKGAITFAPQKNGCHILLAGLRGQFLLALVSGPDTGATLAAWQRVSEREHEGFLPAA